MTWILLLVACAPEPEPTEGSDPLAAVDPHVDSWVPEAFPPAAVERVVFFGDSITEGVGVNNHDNSYVGLLLGDDGAERWPEHEGGDLVDRFGELEVLDVSVGGATTDTVISNQLPEVDATLGPVASGPTLVLGTIGGNDALFALLNPDGLEGAREQLLDNLREIVDFFYDEARFPDGAYLYLTNVYEPTDGMGQHASCFYGLDLSHVLVDLEPTNQATLGLAQEQGWAWIDLRGHFLGHGYFHEDPSIEQHDPDDPSLWFVEDCIHPNARGHHEIRRLFLAALDDEPLMLP